MALNRRAIPEKVRLETPFTEHSGMHYEATRMARPKETSRLHHLVERQFAKTGVFLIH